jgi:hypothetical protein
VHVSRADEIIRALLFECHSTHTLISLLFDHSEIFMLKSRAAALQLLFSGDHLSSAAHKHEPRELFVFKDVCW